MRQSLLTTPGEQCSRRFAPGIAPRDSSQTLPPRAVRGYTRRCQNGEGFPPAWASLGGTLVHGVRLPPPTQAGRTRSQSLQTCLPRFLAGRGRASPDLSRSPHFRPRRAIATADAPCGNSPSRAIHLTFPITLVDVGLTSRTSTPSRAARDTSRARKAAYAQCDSARA